MLTLDGATLAGNRVLVDAGSLGIASRQDSSTYTERNKSMGLSLSVTLSGQVSGQVSGSANFGSGKGDGSFASVREQAGIYAGDGGFAIDVTRATDLKGGVIASTADASRNTLTTGTLTTSDIANAESYRASQVNLGLGLGANVSKDRTGSINTSGDGQPLPGIATPLGTLTPAPPIALGANGRQTYRS